MSTEDEKSKEAKVVSKQGGPKAESLDTLISNSTYPDAAAVFTSKAISLSDIKDTAQIVLDTNALLVPYGIGVQTLAQIETTYKRLLQESRLLIPAQVAREFARNRVTKLSELFQKLSRRRSQLPTFQQGAYPMLEAFDEYQKIRTLENQIDKLITEYRSLLGRVLDHVKSWEWNDPVSLLYGQLFSAAVIVEPSKTQTEIKAEHLRRFAHKVPPGYKDEAKDDQGIGDFLIWLSILEIGAKHKRSVIFVSGEEKPDWWHRSEGQSLYPRFELIDEFRRHSGGHSFHIIKFSQLLELFGASTKVVAEIQKEEAAVKPLVDKLPRSAHAAMQSDPIAAERAVVAWLVLQGYTLTVAPMHGHLDFIAEGGGKSFAVDIMHVRNAGSIRVRFRQRAERFKSYPSDIPIVVIVTAESMTVLNEAERVWTQLDPIFRLSTGIISAEGIFIPVRGL